MSNGFDLGSAAISGLGGIAGALIGGAMSSHAAGKQFRYNAWLQKQASKLNLSNSKAISKWTALNSPTYTRQGLESAGFNPLLAVQNGTIGSNAGSVSGVSGGSVDAPDYNGGIASGLSNVLNFKRLQNETNIAESQQDINYAQADKTKVEKAGLVEKLPYISKQSKADYIKTEMESAKLENDIHYQNEYLNYLDNSLKMQEKVAQINKSGVVYNANTLKDIANEHSPSGKSISFRNYSGGVSDAIRSIGSLLPWSSSTDSYDVDSSGTVKHSKHSRTKSSKGKRH